MTASPVVADVGNPATDAPTCQFPSCGDPCFLAAVAVGPAYCPGCDKVDTPVACADHIEEWQSWTEVLCNLCDSEMRQLEPVRLRRSGTAPQ